MDRLALILAVLSGASVAGALLIGAISMGYYTNWLFITCGLFGAVTAYPVGVVISRANRWRELDWDAGQPQRVKRDMHSPSGRRA